MANPRSASGACVISWGSVAQSVGRILSTVRAGRHLISSEQFSNILSLGSPSVWQSNSFTARFRTFADPVSGLIHERRLPDGSFDHATQAGRFVNPGHALEGLSFVMARLRERMDGDQLRFALEKTRTMGAFGWDDEQGGVFYFRDACGLPLVKHEAPLMAWWPQAEAMTAMLRAYEFSRDSWYLNYFRKVDRYVTDHLRDAEFGEWFAYKAVDGRQFHDYKGSRFKGYFHVPRALLDCIGVLRRLEESR